MSTLKSAVKKFITDAHAAHSDAKAQLCKIMDYNELTGPFGQACIDDARRAESLVKACPMTPEYMENQEFNDLTDDEFRVWMTELWKGLKSNEADALSKGFDFKNAWSLSGALQVRVFLDKALASSK